MPNPKRNWKKTALITAAGMLTLCVLCFTAMWIYTDTPAGKASLAKTYATQTEAAEIVAAVMPSATNIVTIPVPAVMDTLSATRLPSPTVTPKPSSTVTQTPASSATQTRALVPTQTLSPTRTPIPTRTHIPTRTFTPTIASSATQDPDAAGLPGLLPADLYLNMEKQFGMECDGPAVKGNVYVWSCVRDLGTMMLEAEAYSLAGVRVDIIRAEISGYFDATMAAQYLGFVATMPYDGAEPDKAKLWVAENIGKASAEMIIGNVWFVLRGDGSFVELNMSKP